MPSSPESEPFTWVLAKRQLALSIDALAPREFRAFLRSLPIEGRAELLGMLGPHVAEALSASLDDEEEDEAWLAGGDGRSRPEVEASEEPMRLRVRRTADRGGEVGHEA